MQWQNSTLHYYNNFFTAQSNQKTSHHYCPEASFVIIRLGSFATLVCSLSRAAAAKKEATFTVDRRRQQTTVHSMCFIRDIAIFFLGTVPYFPLLKCKSLVQAPCRLSLINHSECSRSLARALPRWRRVRATIGCRQHLSHHFKNIIYDYYFLCKCAYYTFWRF